MRRRVLACGAAAMLAAGALGHDFWIRPVAFRVGVGEVVRAGLLVGEKLQGETRPFRADRVVAFTILGASTDLKPARLESAEGADPAGTFTPSKPGLHVIAYEGKESTITLEPEKFEAYLREEGLEHIIRRREEMGEKDKPGREAYARFAKAFVVVGDLVEGPWQVRCHTACEIVPLSNPLAEAKGGVRRFRVMRNDAPMANAKVVGRAEKAPLEAVTGLTNASGEVDLALTHTGMWLITSVAMDRAKDRTDVDWVSAWASLTFEIPAPPAIPPAGALPSTEK